MKNVILAVAEEENGIKRRFMTRLLMQMVFDAELN